jgi:HSP20 family protein
MSALVPKSRGALSPFAGFRELEERLNKIFGEYPVTEVGGGAWTPAVDLREEKDHYVLEADLPGVKREDIDLSIVDDVLTVKGERNGEEWKQSEGYRSVERNYGSYQRSFRIPGGIDASKVQATYEAGVLRVTLPKPENAKPKQIEVKVN